METSPFETLHCHTFSSDGLLSHSEVLEVCQQNRIGVVAFTDHDVLPKAQTIADLKKQNHSVKFISGIEISCDLVPEVTEKISLHVTGLFVDIENQPLLEFCHRQLEFRRERMREYVRRLQSLGFEIGEADVLTQAKGESVGQPHIVAALSQREKNRQLLENFFKELEKLAETDPLRKSQYEEIVNRDGNQKWYGLVMSRASLHSVYVDYAAENPVSMDEAVSLIRGAGGIALIAHWSYLREKLPISLVEKYVLEKRVDGLETVYAFGNEFNAEVFYSDMLRLALLCRENDLVEGGGGDFHRREDFSLMIDPRFESLARRTPGLSERMLTRYPELSLRWTSL